MSDTEITQQDISIVLKHQYELANENKLLKETNAGYKGRIKEYAALLHEQDVYMAELENDMAELGGEIKAKTDKPTFKITLAPPSHDTDALPIIPTAIAAGLTAGFLGVLAGMRKRRKEQLKEVEHKTQEVFQAVEARI